MANRISDWEDFLKGINQKHNEQVELGKARYTRDEDDWYSLLNGNTFGVEIINQVGGGEGEGEYCHTIFKYEDAFYKFTYNYYSYNGTDYDNAELYQVFPEEKMMTVYN